MGMDIISSINNIYASYRASSAKRSRNTAAESGEIPGRDGFTAGGDNVKDHAALYTVTKSKTVPGGYDLHFGDSVSVRYAAENGYVTAGGRKTELSEADIKRMIFTDMKAETDRQTAFIKHTAEQNMKAAEQQSKALTAELEKETKALKIASKLSRGGKVSQKELEYLMEADPEMFMLAMASAMTAKHHRHPEDDEDVLKDENERYDTDFDPDLSEDGDSFDSYETRVTVSGGRVAAVSERKVTVNGDGSVSGKN